MLLDSELLRLLTCDEFNFPMTKRHRPSSDHIYHYVPFKISRIATELTRGASRLYHKHCGVGGLEWRIIAMLAIEPNITAHRIVGQIGLNKGAVSRSLARLRRDRLVAIARDPDHGRRKLVALTSEGKVLHDKLLRLALERESRLLATLDPGEIAQLITILDRLERQLPLVAAYDISTSAGDR